MATTKTNTKTTAKGLKAKPTVNEDAKEQEAVAVATDDVPEDEPLEGDDGSVKAYDENNEPVETVSAEEVQKAEKNIVDIEVDTTSPTEQVNEDSPNSAKEVAVKIDTKAVGVDTSKKPTEMVKIRLRTDHNCCVAMEYYDFKEGKVYTVPKNVKKILNRAGLLAPL